MSNLAQNQLDFQVYNQKMNGPRSPVDLSVLKANAVAEQKEQAALGKVFDAETSSYVDNDTNKVEATMPFPPPKTGTKRKAETQAEPTDNTFKKSTYEVYTTSPIADAWGNKTTRVVYMGRENYPTAKEARDVSDLLRSKGMETFVYRCNRTPVKNRKRVKGPPRKKKPALKKPKLKSIADMWNQNHDGTMISLGNWQFLDGNGYHAKGKQKIWFVHKSLILKRSTTAEQIRSAAVCIKQCQAWEAVKALEEGSGLAAFIEDLGFHCNGETDKARVRQMTLRIRNVIKVLDPKPVDMMPVVPVSDVVSPASAHQTVHPLPATPLYTN